jgi:hypothetical protein
MKLEWMTVLIAAMAVNADNAQQSDQLNVVLIVADDLGVGDVGCYGSKMISTPNVVLRGF